jgi:hypothetical protein
VATTPQPRILEAASAPRLAFRVEGARALEHVAVPTIAFDLAIESPNVPVRSILLDVQLQIAARRRPYDDASQERLVELFGTPDRWGSTLRTLPWLRTTVVVPPFSESTSAEVQVPLSYDLEVAASRYFNALRDGDVPVELLFSGSVFYAAPDGRLQTTRITWEAEAEHALPVAVWREAMDRHFPGVAWLRLERESFDRLCLFKAKRALPGWEATIEELLEAAEE